MYLKTEENFLQHFLFAFPFQLWRGEKKTNKIVLKIALKISLFLTLFSFTP